MTETRFVCKLCNTIFSEDQAHLSPFVPEEDQIRCVACGSEGLNEASFDAKMVPSPSVPGYREKGIKRG